MYCSQCGKKLGDSMLFCPFCGEPIVIPEQDDAQVAPDSPVTADAAKPDEPRDEAPKAAPQGEEVDAPAPDDRREDQGQDAATELLNWDSDRVVHMDDWARPEQDDEAFSPLRLEQEKEEPGDWRREISDKKEAVVLEKKPPRMKREGEGPVRLEGAAPVLDLDVAGAKARGSGKKSRKHANTLVPSKNLDPNDLFMDAKPSSYDEYDPYDDDSADSDFSPGYVFEDEEDSSFFMRHLRSIVGLSMFVILLLLIVIYAFSKAGQLSLARMNLAWSTEAYSTLGYQNYQEGKFDDAARFYEQALKRDADNYSFASSAAMAYQEAGNTEKCAAMLKRCVEIDPTKLEPYIYLLRMYPDAASRPWDITQLLQQGYQRTGDDRLNVTG